MISLHCTRWQRACMGMTACAVTLVGLCAWPYTVDDAFIVARYATRIAQGLGYSFNPGAFSDGVTGPAWLVPCVIAVWLHVEPVFVAKLVGLACGVLAAWCALRNLQKRAQGTALVAIAGLLLSCQPTFGGSAVAGLETAAAALLVTLASTAALRRPSPRPLVVGVAIATLAWLRPELAAVASVLLTALGVRIGWRHAWPAYAIAVAAALGVCAFRLALTGHALPLALSAKPGSLIDGASYSLRAVLVCSGGLGLVLAASGARSGRSDDRWLAAALLAHVVAVLLAGGDWMPGFRLFAPVLPLYAALAAVGGAHLWRLGRLGRGVMLGCMLLACGVPVLDLAVRLPEWRASGASRERVGRALAARLRATAKRVALVDIGYLGYASGCEVVDLGGITDAEVAALPGGHLAKRIDGDWLARRAPDALLLHSSLPPLAASDGGLLRLHGYPVEMRVAHSSWVQREFRVVEVLRYAPNYYYALLLRRPAGSSAR
jgi:arabinofuranosyltransferase